MDPGAIDLGYCSERFDDERGKEGSCLRSRRVLCVCFNT